MELLKKKILEEGRVAPGGILKVDGFLNHRVDIALCNEIGKEFRRIFSEKNINKILTMEASGIGIACIAAQYFDNVPVVYAKKSASKNIDGEVYVSEVESYTRGNTNKVIVSKRYLSKEDNILIIDDFLAKGKALMGLIEIIKQAGANIVGAGIVIEKGFQSGGKIIRDMGIRLESLAIIENMSENSLTFRE